MGRNGSGKTTLLRLLAGVFRPTSGRLAVAGRIGSLLELGAGFHPDFTGRDNIYLSASIYGLRKQEVDRRFDEIVEFSELDQFIDLPVRTYPSGMYMRLGFAIAVNVDAEVLLLDEVFAVGDEAFQRKCVDRILDFKQDGRTIAFVSHSGAALERMCDRGMLVARARSSTTERRGRRSAATRSSLPERRTRPSAPPAFANGGAAKRTSPTYGSKGSTGSLRDSFSAGDPLVLRIGLEAREAIEAPVLADRSSAMFPGALLGRSDRALGELGWNGASRAEVRFEVGSLPLVEGRFQFNLALSDPAGSQRYHTMEKAAEFAVLPQGDARGFFLFEGDWSLAETVGGRT